MEDREPLLPKGPKIIPKDVDARKENVNENYSRNGYASIEPPPMIISSGPLRATPALINNINLQEEDSTKVPSDYSGYAWLSVLFCCIPLSIAAIYNSDKVLKCIKRGNLNDARIHSVAAKKLSALAIIYGALLIVTVLTLYFVISAAEHKL